MSGYTEHPYGSYRQRTPSPPRRPRAGLARVADGAARRRDDRGARPRGKPARRPSPACASALVSGPPMPDCHWLAEGVRSFVEEPHAAIEGRPGSAILNLTDRRARASREASLELSREPERVLRELPRLQLPAHHEVRRTDVFIRRLHGTLAAAREAGPRDFPELLLQPGVGARTVEALAAVAEVLQGAPCRFTDPARFSLSHGGKDGHPFPVPLAVYDRTISVLKQAVGAARLGQSEKLEAIRRLDEQARQLEGTASGPELEQYLKAERDRSHEYGGRDISGLAEPARKGQLALFPQR